MNSPLNAQQQQVYQQALAAFKQRDYQRALAGFSEVLTAAPNAMHAAVNLALCHAQLGDLTQACQQLQRVLQHYPAYADGWGKLAAWQLQQQQPQHALTSFQALQRLQPDNLDVQFNIASLLHAQPKQAINAYQQLLQQAPDHLPSHINLAYLYGQLAQRDNLQYHLHEILRLDPTNSSAQYRLQALQQTPLSKAPASYISELYDYYADHYAQHMATLNYQLPALIATRLQGALVNTIVDLGCGSGTLASVLRPHCDTLIGIDLSSKILALAAQQPYDQLLQQDFNASLPAADLYIAADSLIYTGQLEPLFARFAQPCRLIASFEAGQAAFQLQPSGRYQHSKNYIAQTAEAAGFSRITVTQCVLRQQQHTSVIGWLIDASH